MKQCKIFARIMAFLFAVMCVLHPAALAQDADGGQWDRLNEKVMSLYEQGKYDRAVEVAHEALEISKQNFGKDHTNVAAGIAGNASGNAADFNRY